MKENTLNKTQELLSISWDTLGEAITVQNIVTSESVLTEIPLTIIPVSLSLLEHKAHTMLFGEVYSIIKMDLNSTFKSALTGNLEGIPLENVDFEEFYIKSLLSEIDGFAIVYNNFKNVKEINKNTLYEDIHNIKPPFYICLKEHLIPNGYSRGLKITLGYRATYWPIGTGYISNAETQEEFTEID